MMKSVHRRYSIFSRWKLGRKKDSASDSDQQTTPDQFTGDPSQQQQQQQEQEQHSSHQGQQYQQQHPPRGHVLQVPGIRHIVAVASGKGGVGKSTVSVNLALALARLGAKVGLLDADIYGPSQHRMMNVREKPELNEHSRFFIPRSNYGVKVMSMGMLVREDEPTIWRGPMVMGALEQLLRQVEWGELDVLVIDLPPGTGDAQLTICQRVPLSGAVVVSTPQDIALIDARRGANMFRKVNVPILGVVENMSYHRCQNCGHEEHIFGHAGARETAHEMDLDFLGEIPLHVNIRTTSDEGRPVTVSDPESEQAQVFVSIAQKVLDKLGPLDHHERDGVAKEEDAAAEKPQPQQSKVSSGPKIIIED